MRQAYSPQAKESQTFYRHMNFRKAFIAYLSDQITITRRLIPRLR
jgi:hypothetical protein